MAYHKNKWYTSEQDIVIANLYYSGITTKSIAKALGVSRGRVHQRITHGRRFSEHRYYRSIEYMDDWPISPIYERLIEGNFISLLANL